MTRPCSDCNERPADGSQGRCRRCYARFWRSKSFRRFRDLSIPEKIAQRTIRRESGCLEWTGAFISTGYGSLSHQGQHFLAHRVAYEAVVGPIPAGLTIDHLCRNTRCVEPTHLEPVTQAENNRRALQSRGYREKCLKGLHRLDETAVGPKRLCRECRRAYQSAWDRARRVRAS